MRIICKYLLWTILVSIFIFVAYIFMGWYWTRHRIAIARYWSPNHTQVVVDRGCQIFYVARCLMLWSERPDTNAIHGIVDDISISAPGMVFPEGRTFVRLDGIEKSFMAIGIVTSLKIGDHVILKPHAYLSWRNDGPNAPEGDDLWRLGVGSICVDNQL